MNSNSNTTDIFADSWGSKEDLVERMSSQTSVLKNERLKQAFTTVDRADFLGADYRVEAYEDYALPTSDDTEISKPTALAYMLEHLGVQEDDLVLNVGAGTGWSTAILATLTGQNGHVVAYEVDEDLAERARQNIKGYDFRQVEIRFGNPLSSLPDEAPFSRILVTATADNVPDALVSQLAVGGTLVLPVDGEILKLTRTSDAKVEEERYPGFRFNDLDY